MLCRSAGLIRLRPGPGNPQQEPDAFRSRFHMHQQSFPEPGRQRGLSLIESEIARSPNRLSCRQRERVNPGHIEQLREIALLAG